MRQIRILQFSGVAALAYGTVLLFRGGPDVQMTIAGMEGSVFPRFGVFLLYLFACVFFVGGISLLMKAYDCSWMKTIEIMGRPVEVNESNKPVILNGLCATGVSLLLTMSAMLIPTSDFRLERIEAIGGFVVGTIGCMGSAFWTSRKLRSHET